MLDHRLRRWSNTNLTLDDSLLLTRCHFSFNFSYKKEHVMFAMHDQVPCVLSHSIAVTLYASQCSRPSSWMTPERRVRVLIKSRRSPDATAYLYIIKSYCRETVSRPVVLGTARMVCCVRMVNLWNRRLESAQPLNLLRFNTTLYSRLIS